VVVTEDAAHAAQDFAAEVRARTESRLSFRVGGKLVARPAEVGQRVRNGQALARLDATDLRLGNDAARAALQAAQAQHAQQEADFRRFQALRAQDFISAAELERRETALRAAKAQLDQAQAQADLQRNQADYGALLATADGVVTAVEAEVGAVLSAGMPVLRLAHDGARDAVFAVPEDRAAAVAALVGRPGALRVRGWSQAEDVPATVREVAAAADPATRTFLVKADLGGAPFKLGQTVTVRIAQPPMPGVHKLPLTAVTQEQGRTVVWVVDPKTMAVSTQPVTVAGADGNAVVITAGLSAGQRIVTAGAHLLSPGQVVRLFDIPLAEAPGAATALAATPAR
jgi:RND family efflux transporter MFP subunit